MRWSFVLSLVACKAAPVVPSPVPTEEEPVSTPECEAMLACDAALDAAVPAYDSVFEGGSDPVYGPDGTCYDDFGVVGCSEECATAYGSLIEAIAAFIVLGDLSDVPQGCQADIDIPTPPTDTGDTDTPPPPTPPPFSWTVTLADGDGFPDDSSTVDADTVTVATANSVANYPDIVEWDFGWADTQIGMPGGWFGEDCDGTDFAGADHCHTVAADATMVLERVGGFNEIVPGQTTLMPVDYPESSTPGQTYVLWGYDSSGNELDCWRMGDEPSYYNASGCQDYVP